MSTSQLEYTAGELLADPAIVEPLHVGGVACHGGFLEDGTYASPRTRVRVPAIAAWQEHHREIFGTPVMDAPLDAFPGAYPNLAQARLLLGEGVSEPIAALLTRIGTVEGFGALIRHLAPKDMQPCFADDIAGTATAHLGRGLVEAHARDEAGWDDKAGHSLMWFVVRDVAFEHPFTPEQTEAAVARMGLNRDVGMSREERIARFQAQRAFPDLPIGVEMLLTTMCRVLFIEIKAFHIFAWAETLLSSDLVAGDGEAARIVSYIRADESPHVDYLRTSLTEMHERAFKTESGRSLAGAEVVDNLWEKLLAESMGEMENQTRTAFAAEVARSLEGRTRGGEILEQFHALGDWQPGAAA